MLKRDVDDYLNHCKARRLSFKTITQIYPHALGLLVDFAASEGVSSLAEMDQRFVDRLTVSLIERKKRNGQPISPASAHSYQRIINSFLAWAKSEGEDVKVKGQLPRLPKPLVEVLSRDEIDHLENAAQVERDKLIIRVLANTGIRVGELCGLRQTDIKDSGSHYHIHVHGKGERDRLISLNRGLYLRLKRYAEKGRPTPAADDHVFLGLRPRPGGVYEPIGPSAVVQLLQQITYRAGITRRVYPHLMRHSFATYALTRGMNPIMLAKVLGHSDLTMIQQVYSHLSVTDTADAMAALFSER